MSLDTSVLSQIAQIGAQSTAPRAKLQEMLRLLAKWRSILIQNTLVQSCGLVVQGGPFAGMTFLEKSSEGCHVPKLLGCYEAELHPHIITAIARGYDVVLNIGAAEGYYAVGFARRLETAQVFAYDTNTDAHVVCRSLAMVNGVSDRVTVGGTFHGEDFQSFADRRVLVICDIEGAETGLLDPAQFPALRGMDVIVELHEVFGQGTADTIADRFSSSHDVTRVDHGGRDVVLPSFLDKLGHLDQLLAVWEWRSGPTPWAVMWAKNPAGRG